MPAIRFNLTKGAYQNDGASPWYATLPVGSPGLPMKIALDTGTNMNWVTSTQCKTKACQQPGRISFDPGASGTFNWVDSKPRELDYGPWGKLDANIGSDVIGQPQLAAAGAVNMGLAISYSGEKFEEMDWDGCMAFPSQGPMQKEMTFVMQALVDNGALDDVGAYITYLTDPATGTGSCTLGGFDPSEVDLSSMLLLPYDLYTAHPKTGQPYDIAYIWTTTLTRAAFGPNTICTDASFCLDTGSSRFKGDKGYMEQLQVLAAANGSVDLTLEVGMTNGGQTGRLVVPPDIWMHTIEAGPGAGQSAPQFAVLPGVPGLFLAGSLLMDHLATVYVYGRDANGALIPQGMAIFNRKGGPKIIQNGLSLDCDAKDIHATLTKLLQSTRSETPE